MPTASHGGMGWPRLMYIHLPSESLSPIDGNGTLTIRTDGKVGIHYTTKPTNGEETFITAVSHQPEWGPDLDNYSAQFLLIFY